MAQAIKWLYVTSLMSDPIPTLKSKKTIATASIFVSLQTWEYFIFISYSGSCSFS